MADVGAVLNAVDSDQASGIEFTDRGEYDLKGVAGKWNLFSVQV
jgi:hypothetical protein